MNIYVVVEGEVGEKKVYDHWIKCVNPELNPVMYFDDAHQDNYYIVSGNGYPNYFNIIENAIHDVHGSTVYDRLVIAIDSEDWSCEDKFKEVDSFVKSIGKSIDYRIIVQHFCLETWALGNKLIAKRNPQGQSLRNFISLYDVCKDDPELLPENAALGLNRAKFAERYLRALLNEKHRNLTYTKKNPGALLHDLFFERVKNRYSQDQHISSFGSFLSAFV